jgi:hypothetical protein
MDETLIFKVYSFLKGASVQTEAKLAVEGSSSSHNEPHFHLRDQIKAYMHENPLDFVGKWRVRDDELLEKQKLW